MYATSSANSAVSEHKPISDVAWLILVLIGIIAAVHIWKLPVALHVLENEFGISLLASGMLVGVIQLASMVGGLVVAWCSEVAGLRRLIILGLLLLAAGSLCGAFSTSITALLICRTIEGFGFLSCTVLAPALIRRTCQPTRLNLAMSAWGAFQGTAALVGFAIGGLLLHTIGWRGLWLICTTVTLGLIIPLIRWTPRDPRGQQGSVLQSSGQRILATIRTWRPWVAGLAFASYTLQWMAVMGFLPTVFIAAKIAPLPAAFLSAIVGGANVVGALMAARFLTRGISPRRIVIVTFIIMAFSSVLFYAIPWQPSLLGTLGQVVCALAFSLVGGTVPAILSRLAVDLAPANGSVAAVIGLMQQIFNVGNFFGPALLAWVATTVGSWQASWSVTCCFSGLGIVCIIYLTRRNTNATNALPKA